MMAQTIAAVDGLIRRNSGKPPKIGFLLGCRRYRADRSYFRLGESLRISADLVFTDGAMFSFECQISLAAGGEIARARLNVYAPDDPQRLMKARLE
jgi:predicted hotdog family 3-hydroxylacyl-ACP dehydratase